MQVDTRRPSSSTPRKKNKDKWCASHRGYRHDTECYKALDEMILDMAGLEVG